jgi:putative nucleotidyltransferase with HDIG domain
MTVMVKLSTSVLEELWFGEDDPAVADAKAAESLAAHLAELEGLRPFPVVVQKVIACVSHPDFKIEQVRDLIEEDPALAARVLRMANSAAFHARTPCASIQDAIVKMGARTVTDLASGMAAMTAFADLKGAGKAVREHCVGTAAIVRALAYRVGEGAAPAMAFLVGLLHDMGKLLILQTRHQSYAELVVATAGVPDELHLQEREFLGYDHAVLGGHVLAKWGLPYPVPKIVAWHHQPARAYQEGGPVAVLVAVLRIADVIDTLVCSDKPSDGAAIKRLAAGPDAIRGGIREKDIVDTFSEASALRGEALMLFR